SCARPTGPVRARACSRLLSALEHLEAQPLERVVEIRIAAREHEQTLDERRLRDRLERLLEHAEVDLGLLALGLEVMERDRDRVLAELAALPDRTRALVGEALLAHPDPHDVRRA